MLRVTVYLMILLGLAPFFSGAQGEPIRVPKGSSITLDGKLSAGEWADALPLNLTEGGKLLLKYDGAHLLVGMKGAKEGWGHLYVTDGKGVYVLHASAALGSVIYQQEQGHVWQPTNQFKWELRDRSLSEQAVAARASYLENNGWVASTSRMGEPGEVEFKVANRFKQGQEMSIAVAYITDPKKVQYWPQSLRDDCLKEELTTGRTPAALRFDLGTWARLRF
jgi:hypothetical protein